MQKKETNFAFTREFTQKLSTLISSRELVVFIVGTVNRNVQCEVQKVYIFVSGFRKFTLPEITRRHPKIFINLITKTAKNTVPRKQWLFGGDKENFIIYIRKNGSGLHGFSI